MPTTNEGLDQVEAVVSSDNSTNNAASSAGSVSADPAPRRRRGGRRVVRGVGAAGASLELKVEEHAKAPLFEEPKLEPVQPARDSADFNDADDAEPSRPRRRRVTRYDDDDEMRDERPRRRRRSSVDVQDEDDRPSRRRRRISDEPRDDRDDRDDYGNRGNRDESSEDRALDAVSALPEGHETRHNPRPMTSLLFQEPILPAAPAGRGSSDDDDADDTGRRGSDDARDSRDDRDDDRPTRRRRRRSHDTADTDRTDASNDGRGRDDGNDRNNDAEDDDHGDSRRSRRSRRLNAQERRAAAEVEQIEEDLVLDGITYAPIDDESRNGNDDDDEQPTRTRRRRRGRGNHEEADEQQTSERESRRRHEDDDEEEGTVTRRRRRRRGGSQDFLARREHVERLMVVRERERHTQISVIEDNVLVEHYVSDIQEVATVGNIYLGRVQNVLPSMEAAFVDIGQARNGVLYAGEVNWDSARLEGQPRRIELAFKSGDPVLVQVTKDPIGHKGARLTSQVTLAGRFLVLVPSGGMTGVSRKLSERERARLKNIVSKIAPKDMGVIIRTAAEGASEEAITKDLENLVRQWERITAKRDEFLHGKRPKLLQGEPDVAIRVVRDIFNDDFSKMIVEGDRVYERIEEYLDTMAPDLKDKLEKWDPAEHDGKDVFDKWQIDSQLRKGMERQVYLPSGGSIVIDRTEAMTTIDVNTGRFIGRGKSLEETVTRCNLEAAEEIARQLRLRDIGGMVMIDFVDMVMPANRDLVLRRLVECLARDRTKHQVAEVTSLGLVQMTRKRIGQGLVEAFSEECPTCKGRGFILHDEPTVSADYDDPYALKGGDPFVKTNKHGHGTDVQVPKGSSPDVKAKLAQIAAAAVAANNADLGEEEQEE